jgi:spermidine/putrescine transport system ATP-binding protein
MAKLYVRPEHSLLTAGVAAEMNAVPVEVTEVAFEGNFVNVHARGQVGGAYMAQIRNEPSAIVPDVGEQLHLNFARDAGVVLLDQAGARH